MPRACSKGARKEVTNRSEAVLHLRCTYKSSCPNNALTNQRFVRARRFVRALLLQRSTGHTNLLACTYKSSCPNNALTNQRFVRARRFVRALLVHALTNLLAVPLQCPVLLWSKGKKICYSKGGYKSKICTGIQIFDLLGHC